MVARRLRLVILTRLRAACSANEVESWFVL